MKIASPEKEHQWLQRLVGKWTYEHPAPPANPGEEPQMFSGVETIRPIGQLWIQAEGRGNMPGGGEATTILTLGYDSQQKKIVGTWIGSMMTFQWVYEGSLDFDTNTLTLHSTGPDFEKPGASARYRETIRLVSDDERRFTSAVQKPDGSWNQFMEVTYHRVK
jgi:hypothetical protein